MGHRQKHISCHSAVLQKKCHVYLNAFKPTAETSIPSIEMTPPSSSVRRRRPECGGEEKLHGGKYRGRLRRAVGVSGKKKRRGIKGCGKERTVGQAAYSEIV